MFLQILVQEHLRTHALISRLCAEVALQITRRTSRNCDGVGTVSRSGWPIPDIGVGGTVSITCISDGQAHAVPDAEFAIASTRHTGSFPAVCGHVVTPASMVAPDGELCRACAERDTSHRRRARHR
jgi:hypothetical protein